MYLQVTEAPLHVRPTPSRGYPPAARYTIDRKYRSRSRVFKTAICRVVDAHPVRRSSRKDFANEQMQLGKGPGLVFS